MDSLISWQSCRKKQWVFSGFLISSILVIAVFGGIDIEQHHINLLFDNANREKITCLCDNGVCFDERELSAAQNPQTSCIPLILEKQSGQTVLNIRGARVVLLKKIVMHSQKRPPRFSASEFANTFHADSRVRWMILKENAFFVWCSGKNPHIQSQLTRLSGMYDALEFDLLYPRWQFHSGTLLPYLLCGACINVIFAGILFCGKSLRNAQRVIIEIIFCIGLYIIIQITTIIVLTSLLFIAGRSISPFHFPASCFLSLLCFFWVSHQRRKKPLLLALLLSMLLLSGCIAISSSIYDFSWDGNSYQKIAIGSLKNGWNPVYQSNSEFQRVHGTLPGFLKDRYAAWVDHYPKASWMFAAVLYKITNNIEAGKSLNLLTSIAVCCLFFHYLCAKRFSLTQIAIISGLTVITPVTLAQMFSHYVDGVLALSLYLLILACVMIVDADAPLDRKEKWLILFCAILFCSNIKFTGLVFAALFCATFFLFASVRTRPFQVVFRAKPLCFFVIAFCCSIGIIGSSSYLKNIREHGHIFYPLMGTEKIDNMTVMRPVSFSEKRGIERLFISIFSKVELSSPHEPELKIPFTFDFLELSNLISTDARTSGYGVWFSGILILSLLIIVVGLSRLFMSNRYWGALFAMIIGNSVILLLVMEESWWARLAPTLYIFPMIAIAFCFMNTKKTLFTRCVTGFLLFVMFGNIICFAVFNTLRIFIKNTITVMELKTLQQEAQQKTAFLSFQEHDFAGTLYNLDDLGMRYIVLQDALPTGKTIYMGITYIVAQES